MRISLKAENLCVPLKSHACAMHRLSDPPAPGEVMRLRGAVLSIPGSSVHAPDAITLFPNELVFTADNYTRGGATGRTLLRASYVGEGRAPSIHVRKNTPVAAPLAGTLVCACYTAVRVVGVSCSATAVHMCLVLRPALCFVPW